MNRRVIIALLLILLAAIGVLALVYAGRVKRPFKRALPLAAVTSTSTMQLTSSAFESQGKIPSIYTCDGKNISPPLSITGVPAKAVSLILLVEDPDAPVGIFDHWLVYDMPAKDMDIAQGTEPEGTHGKGSANNLTYMGPCPRAGTHRYLFTIYALDTKLSLPQGATKLDVVNAMNGHVLEQAQLVGTYERAL